MSLAAGVQHLFEELEELFSDGKTAYVFTSDHGMSAKGAHGDGDPANTQVQPLLFIRVEFFFSISFD